MIDELPSLGLPVPKYSIGNIVYIADVRSTIHQHPCPDCLGATEWKITSPAGGEFTVSCPRCASSSYWGGVRDIPQLKYQAWEPSTRRLTIGSIEAKTSGHFGSGPEVRYMCVETGVGSGSVYDENNIFETEDQAMDSAKIRSFEANSKIQEQPKFLENLRLGSLTLKDAVISQADSSLWNAWYAYRQLKEDMQDWLKETSRISDEDREAFEDKLNWETNYRKSPTIPLLEAAKLAMMALDELGQDGPFPDDGVPAKAMQALNAAIATIEAE